MKKVLVVDDESHIRKMIEIKLKGAGYSVSTAEDGEEGLKLAKELLPSLIIMDMLMPKINGSEACKILKKTKETANIPIIILTALDQEDELEKIRLAGADKVITKPFVPKRLVVEVDQILKLAGDPAGLEPATP